MKKTVSIILLLTMIFGFLYGCTGAPEVTTAELTETEKETETETCGRYTIGQELHSCGFRRNRTDVSA